MTETGRTPADHAVPQRPPLAEPATPRALWPTFLRRTLDDEALRPAQQAAPVRCASAG